MKKRISLLLVLVLLMGSFPGCGTKKVTGDHTLRAAVTASLTCWSPLQYSNAQEKQLAACLNTPLWESVIADAKTGSYQWVFLGAESLEDVTEKHPEDLTKYGGASVFEIRLRQGLCWENGDLINADTYLYSMDMLVRSRTRLLEGKGALAGAQEYFDKEGSFEETVGLYAVDDWTLRYVCREKATKQELMMALAEPFLLHPTLYAGRNAHGYGTTLENTISCGPYRLKQREGGQLILVQNERYWEYRQEDGRLVSTTSFQVDGKNLPQYQTTAIHLFRMTEDEAKQAYQEGKIDFWDAGEADTIRYLANEQLYRKGQSFTLRLFFNTQTSKLKELDYGENKNSIVLSNLSFRKAMSLAIDRAQWVTATEGYTPALGLVNDLSYYDDTSLYRDSVAGMRAICGLYGASLPDDAAKDQVEAAYNAITGYDPAQAKGLMAESCRELVAEGLYREGASVHIQIAWKDGHITAEDRAQVSILEKYLNEAMSGSGFGKLTLEAVDGGENRYISVADGSFAVGLGAWGGMLFDPYSVMRLYCDIGAYESGCWNAREERLILTVNGEKINKTWRQWSRDLCGDGELASLDHETRLEVLAAMERKLLEKYYTIPLASTADCFLLSEKLGCYTGDYNVFYGFGGLRLLQYRYDDAQWQAHLAGDEK